MAHILALDQGTTSSRGIVFDDSGAIVETAQQEFEQIFPRSGWVEHDPEDIWRTQLSTARAALEKAGVSARDLSGIGIANQRETAVLWDRSTGEPICNAIVWQDRRTSEICDRMKTDGKEEFIRQRTGLVIDSYFSATKIAWMLDHVDGARRRAERGELAFGTIDCWLIWNLTGGRVHATDATNASRTMLYNLRAGAWDDELLEALNVPRELLPEVRASSEVIAETDPDLLGVSVLIAGVAGDQQAALFGQACFDRGLAKNTYGTGCFALMNIGDAPTLSEHRLVTTVAWRIGDHTEYALEGSVFIGGAVVQWLRDGLGIISSADEIEALAASVPDSGGVYLVPAFAGLGAPYWDQYARGTITGITRGTGRAHIARAALEAIAHQVADILEVIARDAGKSARELRVDGGASANDLMLQFQSDLLGVDVVRPEVTETTALGAAYLAGLATGVWRGQEQIAGHWIEQRRFTPQMNREEVKHRRERWVEALNRARSWEDSSTSDSRELS